ncbi:hypothetical protein ACOMHN_033639 [Nucella lapillus]
MKDKDPTAFDDFRTKERERIQNVRKRYTDEQKERNKELQRKRQAEYRKRNAEKEKQAFTRGATEKKKSEETTRKEKHRKYMMTWRKNASEEKRKEYNLKRMLRYKKQKVESSQLEEENPPDHLEEQSAENSEREAFPTGSPYKTPEAKRKAASRAKQHEPGDPVKYAQLKSYQLKQAMKSPRKNAALKALGIHHQPVPFVQDKMISYLSSLKTDTTKEGIKQRKKVVRVLMQDSTQHSISELSKLLKQRWHFVAAASAMLEEEEEMRAARHGHSLPKDLVNLVEDFYLSPEISIIIPDKKMIKKDLVPRQCLTKSLKAMHTQFVKATGKQISLSKFKKLRPQNVLTVGHLKHTSCVCKTCANVAQKLKALQHRLKGANIPLSTSAKEVMDVTICQDKDDITKWLCLSRVCSDCGVQQLSDMLAPLRHEGDHQISWLRWQMTKTGGSVQRMMNVTKQGSVSDLLTELADEVVPLADHLGAASWQYRQFRQLRTNLLPNHLLTLMDFAENYRCEYQNEVQAAHWGYAQVTVFPTVNYYRCASCTSLVTESVVIISADLVHDASAVHKYNSLVVQHLERKRNIIVQKQFQFTDGAASQFKSREPFMDVALSTSDYSFPIERSFFGSSHGKGPCDGVGGMVKAAAKQAVLAERRTPRQIAVTAGGFSSLWRKTRWCGAGLAEDQAMLSKAQGNFTLCRQQEKATWYATESSPVTVQSAFLELAVMR